ncbi:hypothetical protein L227DRAFT_578748 [Lentinus tigrinus ALCF2SS1-6]|uniref:Uncharacterized protein n=1 Tax=Lentinus tigrinus ALCF2SS1-6 TaxID=1328759 RepID=A0A5C2RZR5_9APHY|nr:hypothetical protein L227DRAFT_578748 [Lentinus tigrinus ALCF2SS1-6]
MPRTVASETFSGSSEVYAEPPARACTPMTPSASACRVLPGESLGNRLASCGYHGR